VHSFLVPQLLQLTISIYLTATIFVIIPPCLRQIILKGLATTITLRVMPVNVSKTLVTRGTVYQAVDFVAPILVMSLARVEETPAIRNKAVVSVLILIPSPWSLYLTIACHVTHTMSTQVSLGMEHASTSHVQKGEVLLTL
jgi:hypothetical protein